MKHTITILLFLSCAYITKGQSSVIDKRLTTKKVTGFVLYPKLVDCTIPPLFIPKAIDPSNSLEENVVKDSNTIAYTFFVREGSTEANLLSYSKLSDPDSLYHLPDETISNYYILPVETQFSKVRYSSPVNQREELVNSPIYFRKSKIFSGRFLNKDLQASKTQKMRIIKLRTTSACMQ